MATLILIGLIVAAVAAWLLWRRRHRAQRQRLFERPLAEEWIRILERNVPVYRVLPETLRAQLHGHINVFLHEKIFVGCGGLEISDEIRLTIASQACLLLLNRDAGYFPGFKSILVYPDTYVAREVTAEGMLEVVEEDVRAGESWERGPVVLSWSDIMAHVSGDYEGENVVLHEFAHKLDEENEGLDGLPVLDDRDQYASWARVLKREYEALSRRVKRGEPTLLDDYGAESPAEFFAVVTEAFFEWPVALEERHPELYGELRRFYKVDPAAWYRDAG